MRCDDARLKVLLHGDEDSAEFQSAAAHLDICAPCQRRLISLSGQDGLLKELQETLCGHVHDSGWTATGNSSVVVTVESHLNDDSWVECEPISLDFLAAPSHPEMLGRIGRYEVERMVGSGGMGVVLKGFDTELHRVVAIKVLKPHLAHNGAARRRFSREAQSAAAVVHPHVVPIHDVQPEGDTPFLVMQYVPGQSLQTRIDERGPLSPREILRISAQAAAGLAAAHAQGVVHRDVKPGNILLEESVERVLISDFGLARTVDDATLTRTGVVAGTPHYMSPEQASGQSVDHRSDLFSLGSVLYFMCTGRPPFRADHALAVLNRICNDTHRPVDEINPDIPADLADVIDRLLAKKPGDRFRDAHEVEQRLESILLQIQNGRSAHRLRWKRSWNRWRSAVQKTLLATAAIALCVAAGAGLMRRAMMQRDVSEASRQGEIPVELSSQGSAAVARSAAESESAKGDAAHRERRRKAIQDLMEQASQLPTDTFAEDAAALEERLLNLELRWKYEERPNIPAVINDPWKNEMEQVRGLLEVSGGDVPEIPGAPEER